MRVFIAVLILIFSLQSLTKADDIRDFEIEGVSIGDSLLDHLSKDKIKKINSPNKKIKYARAIIEKDLKIYDFVQVWFLDNDKNYIIEAIGGEIDFPNNITGCKKKQKEIAEELKNNILNLSLQEDETKNMHDKTGKSITYHYVLEFPNKDFINVQCYKYSKHMNVTDHLKVMIAIKRFQDHYLEVKNSQ